MSSIKKLRLLFISTDRDIFHEGSGVRDRMRGYASIAEELTIIVFTKSHFEPAHIAPNCWAYPTNSWSRWFYVFGAFRIGKRLFKTLEKSELDLISAQDPFECGLAGYFISRVLRVQLHLQIHTDFLSNYFDSGSWLNFFRRCIAWFLFHKKVTVRAVSERIKSSIFKKMKFRANAYPRIEVFPVWVNRERFKKAKDTVHLHEKYVGFDLIALCVARLEKEKNVDGTIRIIASVKKQVSEATVGLVIVGDGSQRKNLEKLVRSLGLSDRVFFEGEVPDPAPYYKSADLLLVASHYEGYGRQIAEAVASGCLVVTRDVGAARELVTHSNGVVCDEDNEECLIHNILSLGESPAIRDQLKKGAHLFSERAEYETKEQYLKRYQRLLERAFANNDYV
jgi:glycosyltransferase involved in cell wall biosynthesis